MIIQNNKSIRDICDDVSVFEASVIIQKLEFELSSSDIAGVGLAANQIGLRKKVCIIRVSDKIDLVNPIIIEKLDLREFFNEGCLSFPNQWVKTKRFNEVFIKDDLHPAGIICTGIEAVVVQHEIGHLYGETMYDYQINIPGVNQKCWCNSGKKYKKCHIKKVIV